MLQSKPKVSIPPIQSSPTAYYSITNQYHIDVFREKNDEERDIEVSTISIKVARKSPRKVHDANELATAVLTNIQLIG